MASPDGTTSYGATWPDVALAIIAFARADTWNFVLALVPIGVILWLLFPLVTRRLQKDYALRRMERKEKEAQERSSPEGDDDD